jgi:hypothetical protein
VTDVEKEISDYLEKLGEVGATDWWVLLVKAQKELARRILAEGAKGVEPVAWKILHTYRGVTVRFFTDDITQYEGRSTYEISPLFTFPPDATAEVERLKAELAALRNAVIEADKHLTNLQPHIAQLPKHCQPFIDSHVDAAIRALKDKPITASEGERK